MEHDLQNTIALLARMPVALDALLRGLHDLWTQRDEGAHTWIPAQVIAHLIDGEEVNWIPRARTILDHGETRAFAPFDREKKIRESSSKSLAELLDEFAAHRSANLQTLRGWNLTSHDLARTGRHPAFGVVTLSQLLAAWATHDLTHLHQISRIMAHQYRELVGPYAEYLGVLHCSGHSSPA